MKQQSKSILFRTDANSIIGWGHFYRSFALAQMLASDFNIIFAIADPLSALKNLLHKEGFKLISLPPLNYTNPDSRGYIEFECDLHGYLESVNIVVTDGYWFRQKYQAGLRRESVKIAVIEDDGGGEYDADLIINHAPNLTKSNYQALRSTLFALGPKYALVRPEFIDVAKKSINLNRQKASAFICFGGSDENGLAIKAAKQVLKHTPHHIKLLISPSHEYISEVKRLKNIYSKRFSVLTELNAKEIVKEMTSAAFGIVPASGLLYECLSCKLPVISGYFADNQKQIYSGFKNLNAFVDAGDFKIPSWENVLSEVITFVPNNIIDGKSAERYRKEFRLISSI